MDQKQLFQQICFLKENNRYFSSYFSNIGISHMSIDEVDLVYKKSPIMTKPNILENLRDYLPKTFFPQMNNNELNLLFSDVSQLSGNHDRKMNENGVDWILETTTGTTGRPFTILKTPNEKLYESKYLFDRRKLLYPLVNSDNGFLLLEPIDPYLKSLNYRGTDKSQMPLLFEHMLKAKPKWLLCTTLLLRKLYEYAYENQLFKDIQNLHLSFIETTSQKLSDEESNEISTNFGAMIINQYGCREVWNIAYDCSHGHLHVNNKYLQVDIVDEKGAIIEENGKIGEIIITSCLHKAFPIYKYFLGDLAQIRREPCPCGLNTPRIILETGRKKHKLVNTKYYGTEIFRKVLRFIYFKHSHIHIEKIKIIQSGQYEISVYCLLEPALRNEFEKIFVESTSYAVENLRDFNIKFIYNFLFSEDNNALKHEIFENLLD